MRTETLQGFFPSELVECYITHGTTYVCDGEQKEAAMPFKLPQPPNGHRYKLHTVLPVGRYLLSYDNDSVRVYRLFKARPVVALEPEQPSEELSPEQKEVATLRYVEQVLGRSLNSAEAIRLSVTGPERFIESAMQRERRLSK
jgi:hypothetical protein